MSEAPRSHICLLNDASLRHIFNYLPIADRLRFRKVCQRWRAVGLVWQDKKLDLSLSSWTSEKSNLHITFQMFQCVIGHCGNSLIELDFSCDHDMTCAFNANQKFFSLLLKSCPNLKKLDFSKIKATSAGLKFLLQYTDQLESLSIGQCILDDKYDESLSFLFKNLQGLKELRLRKTPAVQSLIYLPLQYLEELTLEDIPDLNMRILFNFAYLNTLIIKGSHKFLTSINDLSNLIVSPYEMWMLETLTIHDKYDLYLSHTSMAKFCNLTILDIQIANLNDLILESIGTHCMSLKQVTLRLSEEVTNNGLEKLSQLPELEYLNLRFSRTITHCAFVNMKKLRILKCKSLQTLKTVCLTELVDNSNALKYLEVIDCFGIDSHVLRQTPRYLSGELRLNVHYNAYIV